MREREIRWRGGLQSFHPDKDREAKLYPHWQGLIRDGFIRYCEVKPGETVYGSIKVTCAVRTPLCLKHAGHTTVGMHAEGRSGFLDFDECSNLNLSQKAPTQIRVRSPRVDTSRQLTYATLTRVDQDQYEVVVMGHTPGITAIAVLRAVPINVLVDRSVYLASITFLA